MTALTVAVAASQCGQQNAAAQVQVVNSIRLELRIQPQVGLPADPGGVVDAPGTAHLPITGPGQLRRFEVQYRLLDLDPTDTVIPVSVFSFRFMIGFTNGGNSTLERAVLSAAETTPNTLPAVSPDLSGLPSWATTPFRQSRGLHGGFTRTAGSPNDFPFNDCGENGRFDPGPGGPAQVIREITPLKLSASPSFMLGEWYGVYSFNFISGAVGGGAVTLTATIVHDAGTAAFGFYTAGSALPSVSFSERSEPATIPIPAPTTPVLAAVTVAVIAGRRRRRILVQTPAGPSP